MEDKPYRLRIPPSSPREHHAFGGGDNTFSKDKGWYPITAEQKAELEGLKLYDTSSASPPLFQIVLTSEALVIDRSEQRAKFRRGTAGNPINPETQQPYDEEPDLRTELAMAKSETRALAEKLDRVLSLIGPPADVFQQPPPTDLVGALEERHRRELAAAAAGLDAAEERHRAEIRRLEETHRADRASRVDPEAKNTDGPLVDIKGATAPHGDERPARPGARSDPSAPPKPPKPKGGAKDDDRIDADTTVDPLGTKAAIEAHDQSLRDRGHTIGR